MEEVQELSSSIAVAVSVFQSVLTAMRFYSTSTAFEAKIENRKIRSSQKSVTLTPGLRKCRSRNEISANENLRSCVLKSARFLEGKAKRHPLIGYHPPFFVFVCATKVCVAQTNGTPTKRWRATQSVSVPKNKRDFHSVFRDLINSLSNFVKVSGSVALPTLLSSPLPFFFCLQKRTHGSPVRVRRASIGLRFRLRIRVPLLLFSPLHQP
jgi:hypothetical protein